METSLAPYLPRLVVEWARDRPEERRLRCEGTAAFVDVSGFTPLSERLARRGKAGAEELTEVMNATLSRLLEVAYADGGGVLKFGGDALLLFFDGPGHETRAARSVFRMRGALREIGRPRTSAGTTTLRMHAGIHSGEFDFFLVGNDHRELLVTGPAATATVHAEASSAAGEVVVSPATAAALPKSALGAEREGGGRLLRGEPPAEPLFLAAPDPTGLELAPFLPVAVRPIVAAGIEPEHRQATVAFVRFHGVDELVQADPDAAAAALDAVVSAAQAAAAEHGVTFLETDADADGGRIVLVAGAPETAGGDDERMLRTLRALFDGESPLPLTAGVSRGRVFAGEVGTEVRRTYTILGATAAVAARLMAHAEPGQILAVADVLERSPTRFETTELPPFLVKGRSAPVSAAVVGPLAEARPAPPARRLPLVGREREVAVLTASLGPVRMGFGSFVELVGEAGIGKSRLAEEITEQTPDLEHLVAVCEQWESATAYSAFKPVLRSLLGVPLNGDVSRNTERLTERIEALGPELLPWLPLIAIPLDVTVAPTREVDELEPAFRRARLHGVVEQLLVQLAARPTSAFFEDVHWMDEASADLLRHLGAQIATKPWLFLVTRRPVGGGFEASAGTPSVPALTLRLEPLAPAAAQALAASAAQEGLLGHELDAIAERAAGNPLFLQELVAAARRDDAELPDTVQAVVTARIDELPPGDRALLRYAAVLGASFSAELVSQALAGDNGAPADAAAWDRLGEFVDRDPYVPGAFRFRHALFRDAAYEGLSYRRRRELHARVADVFERLHAGSTDEHAELLSLHLFHAQEWRRAFEYSRIAGARAQGKHANVEAAQLYRRAVSCARNVGDVAAADVASLWEALGDVSELAGLYADAKVAYRNARRIAPEDGHEQPRLLMKEGVIRERESRYTEALRWYTRGLRAADLLGGDAQGIMRVELSLAYAGVRLRQGLYQECIDWCKKVADEAVGLPHVSGLAHVYYLLHLAYTSTGSPERAAYRGLALPIYEELGDLSGQAGTLNNMGIDAYYEGRWDEALTLYRRAREARERTGDVVGAVRIGNNIGEIKSDQGYYDAAQAAFEETHRVSVASGNRWLALVATGNLGRVAARAGRLDDAQALLEEALAGFREIGSSAFVLETEARIAERAVFAGDHETAFALASDLVARGVAGVLAALVHRVRGYALLQAGDGDGAAECFEQSLAAAEVVNGEYEMALTLEARARLSVQRSDPRADEDAAAARTILSRLAVIETPAMPLPL